MNISFSKKDKLKLIVLFLVSVSNPMYNVSEDLFMNFYSILFLVIILGWLVYLDFKWFADKLNSSIEWTFKRLGISLTQIVVILALAIVIMSIIAETKYQNSVNLVIAICWSISIIVIGYICKDIIFIVLKLRVISINDKIMKWEVVVLVLVNILMVYLALEISFAFGYGLFLSTFANQNLTSYESIYLSFAISNTLPLGETYSRYIEIIQNNHYINVFQIFHVLISKIMNLVVLGLTLNYLYLVVEDRKK